MESYYCKDPYCKGNVVITEDYSVCKKCGVVQSNKNLDNMTYKQSELVNFSSNDNNELSLYNYNVYSSTPSDFKGENFNGEEARDFSRIFNSVQAITIKAHQKRASKVIVKTNKYINLLPRLHGLTNSKQELSMKSSIIINQIYNTWFAARNYEFYQEYKPSLNPDFSGVGFSLPKDSDIISAVSMRLGAKFLRVIKGGISNMEIYRAIKPYSSLSEKFKVHVSKFNKIIKLNNVVDLDRLGGPKNLVNVTKNHYILQASSFCNMIKFPVRVTTLITNLMQECIDNVWLGGKNPKNIAGSCIYHVIHGCSNGPKKEIEMEEILKIQNKYNKKKN